jgi:hypothetical protein
MMGRSFCFDNGLTAESMGNKMIEMFGYLFTADKQPRPLYTLNKVNAVKYEQMGIVE